MTNATWCDSDKLWNIEVEDGPTGKGYHPKTVYLSLTPENAKALYWQLEEIFPTIDEQCSHENT